MDIGAKKPLGAGTPAFMAQPRQEVCSRPQDNDRASARSAVFGNVELAERELPPKDWTSRIEGAAAVQNERDSRAPEVVTGWVVLTTDKRELELPGMVGPEAGMLQFVKSPERAFRDGLWPISDGCYKHLIEIQAPSDLLFQTQEGRFVDKWGSLGAWGNLVPYGEEASTPVDRSRFLIKAADLANGGVSVRYKTARVPQIGKSTTTQGTFRDPLQRVAVSAFWRLQSFKHLASG